MESIDNMKKSKTFTHELIKGSQVILLRHAESEHNEETKIFKSKEHTKNIIYNFNRAIWDGKCANEEYSYIEVKKCYNSWVKHEYANLDSAHEYPYSLQKKLQSILKSINRHITHGGSYPILPNSLAKYIG